MTTSGHSEEETWFEVQLSVPWVVAGTTGVQNVINIAVSEVGKRVNQTSARYSEIVVQDVACPSCGYEYEAALSTTDFALVVVTVLAQFEASSAEESSRIAKRELGVRMKDIPLTVLGVRRASSGVEEPAVETAAEPDAVTDASSGDGSEIDVLRLEEAAAGERGAREAARRSRDTQMVRGSGSSPRCRGVRQGD